MEKPRRARLFRFQSGPGQLFLLIDAAGGWAQGAHPPCVERLVGRVEVVSTHLVRHLHPEPDSVFDGRAIHLLLAGEQESPEGICESLRERSGPDACPRAVSLGEQ
jgi:hypothetical protein